MSLADHATAARIIAECFDNYGRQDQNTVLLRFADVCRDAAEMMEDEIREQAQASAKAHACTLPHVGGGKCPACGAPRA